VLLNFKGGSMTTVEIRKEIEEKSEKSYNLFKKLYSIWSEKEFEKEPDECMAYTASARAFSTSMYNDKNYERECVFRDHYNMDISAVPGIVLNSHVEKLNKTHELNRLIKELWEKGIKESFCIIGFRKEGDILVAILNHLLLKEKDGDIVNDSVKKTGIQISFYKKDKETAIKKLEKMYSESF